MNITGVCPYETPCGWCSKWDKKCDNKIGRDKSQEEKYDLLKPCYDCIHEDWNMSQCKECNPTNRFKYFERKVKSND